MTDKVIVYSRPDGGVSVCIPALAAWNPRESEDQFLARVIVRSIPPDAQDVRILRRDQVPEDRTFRNAWSFRNGKIGISMDNAREIHRNRIRRERKRLFREADAEQLRYLHDPDKLAEIEERKQALRDAPADPAIEAAQSPAELASIWPLPTEKFKPRVRAEIPPFLTPPEPEPERQTWSLKKLLRKASQPEPEPEPVLHELEPAPSIDSTVELPPEPPRPPDPPATLRDSERRRAAKQQIAAAITELSKKVSRRQVRFEVALEAKNGRVDSIAAFQEEATQRGITVQMLVEQIIAERRMLERRMIRADSIELRAIADIDAASGDAIDAIASVAATDINGD